MICIYHNRDLDGWMSAAIVNVWFNKYSYRLVGDDENGYETVKPRDKEIKFIGYDYGEEIPNIPDDEDVIMVDISFPSSEMVRLGNREGVFFWWVDHHISAINGLCEISKEYKYGQSKIGGLQDTTHAACELTWMFFMGTLPMPESVRLLGRYDCFGHKGTDEELDVLKFQYASRAFVSSPAECESILLSEEFDPNYYINVGAGIYNYLCTDAISAYSKKSSHVIGANKFAAINKSRFNPVNFGIDYHKDGYDFIMSYFFDGSIWQFSLYNDNGNVDVSLIAKQFGGGGHKGASGFVLPHIDDVSKLLFSYVISKGDS